jgi:hypothetical protein
MTLGMVAKHNRSGHPAVFAAATGLAIAGLERADSINLMPRQIVAERTRQRKEAGILAGLGAAALAACNQSPQEQAADNIEANAENVADTIEANAENVTDTMQANAENAADTVRAEGENAADATRNGADADGNSAN